MLRSEILESFGSHPKGRRLSTFIFEFDVLERCDALFFGTEEGVVSVFFLPEGHSMRNVKAEDLQGTPHSANVTVLMHSKMAKLTEAGKQQGYLWSGSLDRTVRVWNSSTKALVQVLPHTGPVTGMCDGHDGSVLTVSIDGVLKVWVAQRGRGMMLNPFFECTFHLNVAGSSRGADPSSLAVGDCGAWSAFVGDSSGTISVYRKRNIDTSNMEDCPASSEYPLFRWKRLERVQKLGITQMHVLNDEKYLITLGNDGVCKVLDSCLGTTILTFHNPRKCAFTGLTWDSSESSLILADELGFVQMVNMGRVKEDASVQITKHQHLGGIIPYRFHHSFFTLLKPLTAKYTMPTNSLSEPKQIVNGEIKLVRIVDDFSVADFLGHEASVLGISINPQSRTPVRHQRPDAHNRASDSLKLGDSDAAFSHLSRYSAQILRVSKEESVFFSVGSDFTIRCWDDVDASECFQFRSKNPSEFSSMKMLWSMNLLATGHENGTITLWNSDAGTQVSSKALNSSLTCLVEARNSRAHLLVVSDISGKIGVWNLSNPVKLQVENVFQSVHDPEDPGVLCLTFHTRSNTFFSGGLDRSIRVWKLNDEDSTFGLIPLHLEPVCCLECSDTYLVSGDEGGEIVLWSITIPDIYAINLLDLNSTKRNAALPIVSPVCKWFCARDEPITRAIIAMQEISPENICFVQAGVGVSSLVWNVRLFQHTELTGDVMEFNSKPCDPFSASGLDILTVASAGREPGELFRVFRCTGVGLEMIVSSVTVALDFRQEGVQRPVCAQLVCNEGPTRNFLYLGLSTGAIRRVAF